MAAGTAVESPNWTPGFTALPLTSGLVHATHPMNVNSLGNLPEGDLMTSVTKNNARAPLMGVSGMNASLPRGTHRMAAPWQFSKRDMSVYTGEYMS